MSENLVDTELTQCGGLIFRIPQFKSMFRYQSWKNGFFAEIYEDSSWICEQYDLGLPLLSAASAEADDTPLNVFINAIPIEIRQQVEPYHYCQTLMLQWLNRSNAARDLLRISPNLLWLLICESNEHCWSEEKLSDLLSLPRKALLEAIVGHGSPLLVRILEKVQLNHADRAEYLTLKKAFNDFDALLNVRIMMHIPIHAIYSLCRFPWLSGSKAFRVFVSLSFNRLMDCTAQLTSHEMIWTDALNLSRLLGIDDGLIALNRCQNFDEVKRLHDRWTDHLNRSRSHLKNGHTQFPPPPIEGDTNIHPITTAEDLNEEGRLMHHCVASYSAAIMSGRSYIYRILEPQRATIELRLRGDVASIRQVSLVYNRRPDKETLNTIVKWLESKR